RYEEEDHSLVRITAQDIREYTGRQKLMKSAPVGLVYVADLSRMNGPMFRNEEAQRFCAWSIPASSARTCICIALRQISRPPFSRSSPGTILDA
ncbi:MAG TPA: hypothetical protein PKW16_10185, partial [Treponemataceae bacterium]|nr:hypothetical protein [Treponemataceae bacterium]